MIYTAFNHHSKTASVSARLFAVLLAALLGFTASYGGTGHRQSDMASVPSGTTLKIRLDDGLSTQKNTKGDEFRAVVLEAVRLDSEHVIPKGTQLTGRILNAKRAGRIAGRASLRLKFDTLRLPNGGGLSLETSVLSVKDPNCRVRGEESTIEAVGGRGKDATGVAVGAGAGGTVGAIAGGKKGGIIGTATGAAISLAGVLGRRGRDVELGSGTEMTLRLNREVSVPLASLR